MRGASERRKSKGWDCLPYRNEGANRCSRPDAEIKFSTEPCRYWDPLSADAIVAGMVTCDVAQSVISALYENGDCQTAAQKCKVSASGLIWACRNLNRGAAYTCTAPGARSVRWKVPGDD